MRTPNKIESILIEFFDRDYKSLKDVAIAPFILSIRIAERAIIKSQQKFKTEQKGDFLPIISTPKLSGLINISMNNLIKQKQEFKINEY